MFLATPLQQYTCLYRRAVHASFARRSPHALNCTTIYRTLRTYCSIPYTGVEPEFEPFFRSTQPDWTRFWTLRANPTCLNPKFEPKIGLNQKKWIRFGRTNYRSDNKLSPSSGLSANFSPAFHELRSLLSPDNILQNTVISPSKFVS